MPPSAIFRILPADRAWPLHAAAATRHIEQQAIAGLPAHSLMRRAGDSVARLSLALAPHAHRVWVAAGPGNNGGDGMETALQLQAAGRQVSVTWLGDAARLSTDAKDALARAQAAGVHIATELPGDEIEFDFAVDALLGIGAAREPAGALLASIQRLNRLSPRVLAVDLPSGLAADTGCAVPGACVRAAHTLSLLTLKPGLFTAAGRDHAGTVWLDTLGCDADTESADAWLQGASATPHSAREHTRHKGSFGDVAVVGGANGMRGAALLAARAAHAAGAGRVYVDCLEAQGSAANAVDPVRPELMFATEWCSRDAAVLKQTTVVCGCGGGEAVRRVLPRLLSLAPRLVLDADALNAVAADASLLALLRRRRVRQQATVLTPHPLEAARLLGCSAVEVQSDRLHAARRLVETTDCVVVLKGSGSLIAAPGELPRINATGNGSLASAGTGDVLAGWLGGLWAQAGLTDNGFADVFGVAARAVAEHGAAAEPERPGALRAGDLIEALHRRSRGLA